MAKLEGQSIASSYEQLLHVDRDGGGNTTTLVDVKDGKNTTTFALKLATDKAEIDGKLTIDQDSNSPALVIDTEATSEYAIHIDSPAITTSDVININADALTTGSILDLSSDSSSNSSRQLVKIVNDNTASTGTVPLFVQQDAAQSGITLEQNGTAYGLYLDINGNGNGINVENAGTGNAIKIDQNGNAVALNIDTEGTGSAIYASSTATSSNSIIELYRAVDADGEYVAQWMGKAPSTGDALALSYYYHTGTDAYAELSIYGGNGLIVKEGGNVGIGSNTSPDNTLHVYKGDAGSVSGTTGSGTPVIIENNTHNFIQFLCPSDKQAGLYFGSPGRNYYSGTFAFDEANNKFVLEIDEVKKLVVDNNSRISLSNNDSGTQNTVFGSLAGTNIDAGSNYNVFIGHNVAGNGTLNDATENTGVGYGALAELTSGDGNTAIGRSALLNITEGTYNSVVGFQAADALNTGQENVVIGRNAMGVATTQSSCTLIGVNAGANINNNDANGTVAVGINALTSLTEGQYNTSVGTNAGENITTGDGNTAIGYRAMDANTTGNQNTAVGYGAAGAIPGGALGNTAIGYNALANGSNEATDENTCIGHLAGDLITSGENNVIIGAGADVGTNTDNNSIVIGREAIGNGTNTVVIGNSAHTDVYLGHDGNTATAHSGGQVVQGVGNETMWKVVNYTIAANTELDTGIDTSFSFMAFVGATESDNTNGDTAIIKCSSGTIETVAVSQGFIVVNSSTVAANRTGFYSTSNTLRIKSTFANGIDVSLAIMSAT